MKQICGLSIVSEVSFHLVITGYKLSSSARFGSKAEELDASSRGHQDFTCNTTRSVSQERTGADKSGLKKLSLWNMVQWTYVPVFASFSILTHLSAQSSFDTPSRNIRLTGILRTMTAVLSDARGIHELEVLNETPLQALSMTETKGYHPLG
jgi:hypothetical protein